VLHTFYTFQSKNTINTTLSSQDLVGNYAVTMYLHEKKGETAIQCIVMAQTAKVLCINVYTASER
jgi:hypothetical protein